MMLLQSNEIEKLQAEVAELTAKLDDRSVAVDKVSTLAEASILISNVFHRATKDYLGREKTKKHRLGDLVMDNHIMYFHDNQGELEVTRCRLCSHMYFDSGEMECRLGCNYICEECSDWVPIDGKKITERFALIRETCKQAGIENAMQKSGWHESNQKIIC